jgi:hypothetical protein
MALAYRVLVRMSLDAEGNEAHTFHFPPRSRSLLYRFHDGGPDELIVGAVTTLPSEDDLLVPGGHYEDVVLEFWADEKVLRPAIDEGEPFVVWHGDDVGTGEVVQVLSDIP